MINKFRRFFYLFFSMLGFFFFDFSFMEENYYFKCITEAGDICYGGIINHQMVNIKEDLWEGPAIIWLGDNKYIDVFLSYNKNIFISAPDYLFLKNDIYFNTGNISVSEDFSFSAYFVFYENFEDKFKIVRKHINPYELIQVKEEFNLKNFNFNSIICETCSNLYIPNWNIHKRSYCNFVNYKNFLEISSKIQLNSKTVLTVSQESSDDSIVEPLLISIGLCLFIYFILK